MTVTIINQYNEIGIWCDICVNYCSFLELLLYSVLAIAFEEHSLWILSLVLQVLLHFIFIVIQHYLLKDKVLIVLLLQAVNLEIKVEGANWLTGRLVIGEVELAHVRVR